MLDDFNKFANEIKFTDLPVTLGIDEAGRGPVIGSMVYGLYVAFPGEKTNFKDSKILSPSARQAFFENMNKNYAYFMVDPVFITTHMEAGSLNLNQIAKLAVLNLLKMARERCSNIKTVYIDGLGNNKTYEEDMKRVHPDLKFIIENKADSKYQEVSGASIVAKVVRDTEVHKYKCGSGYPGDPLTQSWLKTQKKPIFEFPKFVRHSWATIKTVLPQKKSKKLEGSLAGFYTGPN